MRTFALILAVAAAALVLVPARAQEGKGQPGKPEAGQLSARIKELQKERIAALRDVAEMETALHKNGQVTPEAVLEAKAAVCEAELDAAEKDSDRITILKTLIAALADLEQTANARKQAAEGTEVAALKVKARRLEAQIRLEQVQGQGPGLRPLQGKKFEPQDEKIVVTRLQAKDVAIAERFVCEIRSHRHIDVRSLESGYLEEIHVKEGQAVKRGDVLFNIQPTLYKARLDAEMAEVQLAKLNLKNIERLFQNKAVSEDEVAMARARLDGALAKAKIAQSELNFTMVRAPFDGIVGRLQQQVGSLVTERESLTTLCDNSLVWVYFNVPQACYLDYMSGSAKDEEADAELVLAGGKKFPQRGKIAAIESQFNQDTGTIAFRADFPNPDGLLRHGMTGNLEIHRTLRSAVVIPQRATFEILGKRYVYVVDKDDVAHQREIAIQREQGDDFVVTKGLDANDRIVLDGVSQIRKGEKLKYELRQP